MAQMMTEREDTLRWLEEQAERLAELDRQREALVTERNAMMRLAQQMGCSVIEIGEATHLSRAYVYKVGMPLGDLPETESES